MAKDNRARFLKALQVQKRQLSSGYRRIIQDLQSSASLRTLEEAFKTRDYEKALRALNLLTDAPLADIRRLIENALLAGAAYQISTAPARRVTELNIRFDGNHPEAERFIRENAGRLITEISRDQRALIRSAIEGVSESTRSYRQLSNDLVGRRVGNQRVGGLIGLHSRQAEYARNMSDILRDAEKLARTFSGSRSNWRFTLRDKRFDSRIAKAIKEGRALTNAEVNEMTARYSDRLLRHRADTIAITEGNKAMNAGRAEFTRQLIERGDAPPDAVEITWDANDDDRTRNSHASLNGRRVRFGERFSNGLRWPHDDGPASETIRCRCTGRYEIDYSRVR